MFTSLYPLFFTAVGLYFYRRDGRRMQTFYRLMTTSYSCRMLYSLVLIWILLVFNACYTLAFGSDIGFFLSSLLIFGLLVSKRMDRLFFQLQNKTIILTVSGACLFTCLIPGCWPLGVTMYLVLIASFFFPSKKLLEQLSHPNVFTKLSSSEGSIVLDYYAR